MTTHPTGLDFPQDEDHPIAPRVDLPDGSTWVWTPEGYVKAVEPWAVENHIGPTDDDIKLLDIPSFTAYVQRYGQPETTLIQWGAGGITATLDYGTSTKPGRAQWFARYNFEWTPEFAVWHRLYQAQSGSTQQHVVEALEGVIATIVEPAPSQVIELLRTLRANVKASADSTLKPDGTTAIAFTRESSVTAGPTAAELPATITIQVPILRGHVDDNGKPILYKIDVKPRANVLDGAKLMLRFGFNNLEASLEDVYADLIGKVRASLPSEYMLYRSA